MHTDAHSMHSHIRRISRGTADNERGCLSPFVTAVPASMHTESLSYFSISLSLFRSSTSPGFHLYQASPRTTNHPYLSGLIRIIDVFWWTQYFIFWLTRKSQLILWNFSIKIFSFVQYFRNYFVQYILRYEIWYPDAKKYQWTSSREKMRS